MAPLVWVLVEVAFSASLACCDHLAGLHGVILALTKFCQSLQLCMPSMLLSWPGAHHHALGCKIFMRVTLQVDRHLLSIAHDTAIVNMVLLVTAFVSRLP